MDILTSWSSFTTNDENNMKAYYRRVGKYLEVQVIDNEIIDSPNGEYNDSLFDKPSYSHVFYHHMLPENLIPIEEYRNIKLEYVVEVRVYHFFNNYFQYRIFKLSSIPIEGWDSMVIPEEESENE